MINYALWCSDCNSHCKKRSLNYVNHVQCYAWQICSSGELWALQLLGYYTSIWLFVLQMMLKGEVLRVICCLFGHRASANYVADLHEYRISRSHRGKVSFHVRKLSEMTLSRKQKQNVLYKSNHHTKLCPFSQWYYWIIDRSIYLSTVCWSWLRLS